jgi:hypothetical protein
VKDGALAAYTINATLIIHALKVANTFEHPAVLRQHNEFILE